MCIRDSGDTVQKGQLLLTIRSDDVSGGYSNYRMAVADEILAKTQFERSKDLYDHGAIALNDLQVAQDTEDKAKIAVDTLAEHLRLLGNDPVSYTHLDVYKRQAQARAYQSDGSDRPHGLSLAG